MSDGASSNSSSKRNIRHYSMVQNRPVFYEDLEPLENKIMLSIDIPRYFYLDSETPKTQLEIDYEKRMKETVIYVTLNENIGAREIS